ncbi:MAG: DUF3102 domain-containing protein [Verrucomicrobiota bacterium]
MKNDNCVKALSAISKFDGWIPSVVQPEPKGEPGLEELEGLINQAYGASLNHADGSRAAARYAIQCAVFCGGCLRKVKALLPHGDFSAWIVRHVRIDPRTARNYMKLHVWIGQHQKDILYHKPHSLRQFYILAGILPEDGPKRMPKDAPDELGRLRRLVRRTCWEAAAHRQFSGAAGLLKALNPLAKLLEEITADIDESKTET